MHVTAGSHAASKKHGASRVTSAAGDSPARTGNAAPCAAADSTASTSASGVSRSVNFCAVRLWYGPEFSQKSVV